MKGSTPELTTVSWWVTRDFGQGTEWPQRAAGCRPPLHIASDAPHRPSGGIQPSRTAHSFPCAPPPRSSLSLLPAADSAGYRNLCSRAGPGRAKRPALINAGQTCAGRTAAARCADREALICPQIPPATPIQGRRFPVATSTSLPPPPTTGQSQAETPTLIVRLLPPQPPPPTAVGSPTHHYS
ncbi:uncharacterized protein LOC126092841 [Schistocerca cancellata]|uniref:uncharacterized protein LOC126092841 n=1 Tax=Schistocerca cancellata TaxID=274614 RepID=UPI002117E38E|nr:uncharacterized protein LOC126092841 [Schistocerca cancellata]